MKIYYYDSEGKLTGSGHSDGPVPDSTEIAPPEGNVRWNGSAWDVIPPPPVTKEDIAVKLNQAVGQYIYTKYDAGTQASLLAIYSDGRTPAQAKAAAEVVWDWIRTVMVYYYTCKAEILEGARTEWDFSQFDATDPGLSLADFM